MTDDVQARPRTNTRLKAEAPPGMSLHGEEGRKSIGRYEVLKTIGKGANEPIRLTDTSGLTQEDIYALNRRVEWRRE